MATYNQVSKGSSDSETIRKLQETLNSKGNYNLAVDGIFGDKTYNAVTDYQKKNNLAVDGIVGNNTWASLTAAAPAATTTTPAATAATQTTVPEVEPWSYDDFQVSDETLAAGQHLQELEANKPGDFTYDPYAKSDDLIAAETAASDHAATKPGEYQKGEDVLAAEGLLQEHLNNKPGEYQSQWTPQMDAVMDQIINREKFSYDLASDPMYQQYKQQYMLQGQQAMLDAMGQAAAMTGGYGNSYAQTVGQQTYQGHLQQLNDQVPQLYQLALDQYNQAGQELYNQYGLYADRESQDYGRHRDSVSDYYTDLDYLSGDARYKGEQDYGRYRDSVSDFYTEQDRLDEAARYQGEQEYGRWADQVNLDYGIHRDNVSDYYTDVGLATDDYWNRYSRDYAEYTDGRDMSYQQHQDDVTEYWRQKEYAYQQDRDAVADQQYREQMDYQRERDAVSDSQWQQEYNRSAASAYRSSSTETTEDRFLDFEKMGYSSYDDMIIRLKEYAYDHGNVALAEKLIGFEGLYMDATTKQDIYNKCAIDDEERNKYSEDYPRFTAD